MKKEALGQFDQPDLILFAFILFLVTFIGILVWTFQKNRKKHYEKMARIPLTESENGGSHE